MAKVTHRAVTLQDLQKLGYPVTSGRDYIPKEWLPKRTVSLDRIRQRLAKIKGTLAQTIVDLRSEEG